MHLFVSQYNRMIADRDAEEAREEHVTKQVARPMRIGVPIEADGARVYTRAIFDRFSKELFKSGAFACGQTDEEGVYRVILLSGHADRGATEYKIVVSPDGDSYLCDCKLFEHCGIPCRHILRTGVDTLPQGLVMKRWTRDAKEDLQDLEVNVSVPTPCMDSETMRSILYATAMELVKMCTSSKQAFDLGVELIGRAKQSVSSMTVIQGCPSAVHDGSSGFGYACPSVGSGADKNILADADVSGGASDVTLNDAAAPPRVRSRGRPKETRFKSPIELPPRRRKMKHVSKIVKSSGVTSSVVAPSRASARVRKEKCRICLGTGHFASKCPENVVQDRTAVDRKCKTCGEKGHYRSTCGRKSSYSPVKATK
ncbi:hypothetical protein ACP70R_020371 [Stipagrostis hirtigluma subsp. patula]